MFNVYMFIYRERYVVEFKEINKILYRDHAANTATLQVE